MALQFCLIKTIIDNEKTIISRLKFLFLTEKAKSGKSYWRVRLSTVYLLVLNSLVQLLFILKIWLTFFTIQATLMRRSTVLSPPAELGFPAYRLQFFLPGLPLSFSMWLLLLVSPGLDLHFDMIIERSLSGISPLEVTPFVAVKSKLNPKFFSPLPRRWLSGQINKQSLYQSIWFLISSQKSDWNTILLFLSLTLCAQLADMWEASWCTPVDTTIVNSLLKTIQNSSLWLTKMGQNKARQIPKLLHL